MSAATYIEVSEGTLLLVQAMQRLESPALHGHIATLGYALLREEEEGFAAGAFEAAKATTRDMRAIPRSWPGVRRAVMRKRLQARTRMYLTLRAIALHEYRRRIARIPAVHGAWEGRPS